MRVPAGGVYTDFAPQARRGLPCGRACPRALPRVSWLSLGPVDGRIRFEASPLSAERSGIKLGARLLALAERVVTR